MCSDWAVIDGGGNLVVDKPGDDGGDDTQIAVDMAHEDHFVPAGLDVADVVVAGVGGSICRGN